MRPAGRHRCSALWLASLLVRLPFVLRMRVEVLDDGLVVIDRRRWVLPWSEITEIAIIATGRFGSAALFVNDHDGSHELVALRAFWPWQRYRLHRQAALIRQYWRTGSGSLVGDR